MASGEGSSESLTHKTWVLKVSIHCQGCKKKVLKILKGIQGVYETEVDARLNKVTVKADVDAEAIIRRLEKSGKHAELWQEKKTTNQTANNGDANGKNEGKGTDTTPSAPKPSEAPKIEAKAKPQAEPSKTDNKRAEITSEKQLPTSESKKDDSAKKEAEEPAAADADNKETASASGEATASDGSGHKKGKKAQKEHADVAVNNFPAGSTSSPSPHDLHNYPQHAEYVMSYNTAQSSASQSYYAPPVPPTSQSYLHMTYPYPYPPPPEFYGGPSYYDTPVWMQQQPPPPPPPHDNMFSDENPNSCNLM